MLRLYKPENCCCCFDLRTGTLILSILSLIGACSTVLSLLNELLSNQTYHIVHYVFDPTDEQACDEATIDCRYILEVFDAWYMPTVLISLVTNIIAVIIASLCIHGVRKEKPNLLLPYIWCIAIEIVLIWVLSVIPLAMFPSFVLFFTLLITCAITSLLPVHFFLCLHAYYTQMKENLGEEPMEFKEHKEKFVV